jgi:hypothetical protein
MRSIFKCTQGFLAGLFLTSCITTQIVPIDQLEPGKVSLSPKIRKVALISRNFKFSVDTLSGYYNLDFRLKKGTKADNKLIDSLSVVKSIDTLRKILLESGRFDEVFVYPFNTIKPHRGNKELPLSQSYIKTICAESETDAVVSLEMLSFFYNRYKGSIDQAIQAAANVKITAIWSVYTPDDDGPADRYAHSEVIRWSENDPQGNKKYTLPGRREAVSAACSVAAKNYSKRIVPYWAESSRIIVGLAGAEWDKAFSKFAGSSQTNTAGIAALNLAIAHEMLGNPEKAAVWSEKSVKLLKHGESGRIARGYAATLYERQLKAASLNSLLKNGPPIN